MTELDKLEEYLKQHGYKYERIDVKPRNAAALDRHQIIVYDGEYKAWDAVCHYGSYGYEQGLLEIIGSDIVSDDACDAVEGWLTAEDVISRLKPKETESEK